MQQSQLNIHKMLLIPCQQFSQSVSRSWLSLPIHTVEQAQMLTDEFVRNGNWEPDFTEFISMVKKYYPVKGMLNYFGLDDDGYIMAEEHVDSLKQSGINITV